MGFSIFFPIVGSIMVSLYLSTVQGSPEFLNVYLCVYVLAGVRGDVGKQWPDVPGPHTRSPAFMADLFVIMAFKRSHVLIKMTDR